MFPEVSEIKNLRLKSGLSQSELAQQVGISQSAITKYESGSQMPNYHIAARIFEVLLQQEYIDQPDLSTIVEPNLISLHPGDTLEDCINIMKKHSISQIPILNGIENLGKVDEAIILDMISNHHDLKSLRKTPVEEIMTDPFPMLPKTTKIREAADILKHFGAVLVFEKNSIIGIVSKADILNIY